MIIFQNIQTLQLIQSVWKQKLFTKIIKIAEQQALGWEFLILLI